MRESDGPVLVILHYARLPLSDHEDPVEMNREKQKGDRVGGERKGEGVGYMEVEWRGRNSGGREREKTLKSV